MRGLAMLVVTLASFNLVGCITLERAPEPTPDVGVSDDTAAAEDAANNTGQDTAPDAALDALEEVETPDDGEVPDAGPFECMTTPQCEAIVTVDACTTVACQAGKCVVTRTDACCIDESDCPPGDECNTLACEANACVSKPKTGAPASCGPTDDDGDGVALAFDNCPGVSNAGQADADADGAGDHCDLCPLDADQSCTSGLVLAVNFDAWSGSQVTSDLGGSILKGDGSVAAVGGMDAWSGNAAHIEDGGSMSTVGGPSLPDWPASGAIVLEAYIRPMEPGTVLSLVDESGKALISLEFAANKARCTFNTASGDKVELGSAVSLADGNWHHVVCADGMDLDQGPNEAKAALIIDGRIASGARLPGVLAPPKHVTAGGAGFVGSIDRLRVASELRDFRWDTDMDGVADVLDNCPSVYNRPQLSGSIDPSGYDCSPFTARACTADSDCEVRGECWLGSCGAFGLCQWQDTTGQCGDGDAAGACEAGQCRVPVTDYTVTFDAVLEPGHHFFGVLTVQNAKLQCVSDTAGFEGRGCIIHANAVFVDFGGTISAEGEGFPTGSGPQIGCACNPEGEGGTHAGLGGNSQGCALPYGSQVAPMALGSSGRGGEGCTGAVTGAGSVQLLAHTVVVLNGDIELEGLSKDGLGGSGGSLLIRAPALIGTGNVHLGGGGGGAGGSGGRAAIFADTTGYTGSVFNEGGGGVPGGPDGTVIPPELADN